ncbi:MAG: hypothetical protein C0497_03765 [Gemmatimonas sp.]|nr:hypothetical protein [Gemmatimonas sp.]
MSELSMRLVTVMEHQQRAERTAAAMLKAVAARLDELLLAEGIPLQVASTSWTGREDGFVLTLKYDAADFEQAIAVETGGVSRALPSVGTAPAVSVPKKAAAQPQPDGLRAASRSVGSEAARAIPEAPVVPVSSPAPVLEPSPAALTTGIPSPASTARSVSERGVHEVSMEVAAPKAFLGMPALDPEALAGGTPQPVGVDRDHEDEDDDELPVRVELEGSDVPLRSLRSFAAPSPAPEAPPPAAGSSTRPSVHAGSAPTVRPGIDIGQRMVMPRLPGDILRRRATRGTGTDSEGIVSPPTVRPVAHKGARVNRFAEHAENPSMRAELLADAMANDLLDLNPAWESLAETADLAELQRQCEKQVRAAKSAWVSQVGTEFVAEHPRLFEDTMNLRLFNKREVF